MCEYIVYSSADIDVYAQLKRRIYQSLTIHNKLAYFFGKYLTKKNLENRTFFTWIARSISVHLCPVKFDKSTYVKSKSTLNV